MLDEGGVRPILCAMIDVGLRETRAATHADDVALHDIVAVEQFGEVDRLGQTVAEAPTQERIERESGRLTGDGDSVIEPLGRRRTRRSRPASARETDGSRVPARS